MKTRIYSAPAVKGLTICGNLLQYANLKSSAIRGLRIKISIMVNLGCQELNGWSAYRCERVIGHVPYHPAVVPSVLQTNLES